MHHAPIIIFNASGVDSVQIFLVEILLVFCVKKYPKMLLKNERIWNEINESLSAWNDQ